MENFWQDLRHSVRMLLKRPGFTLTVVMTLALGIGANATIFTWIKAVLLAPLPGIERPDELVEIWGATRHNSALSTSRSEEHTSELQSPDHLVCRLLLEKKKK